MKPTKVSNEMATKILRTIPRNNAFYFFTEIGQYSGKASSNLADFCQKIKSVDRKSVEFHFKRGDFRRWLRTTVGDSYLATTINNLSKSLEGEDLRNQIAQTVEKRLTELKSQLASEATYLEKY